MKKNIYITGYMASGKSTFGYFLARHKSMRFIDLDKEIEKREGMSVSQIFKKHGENYFREIERRLLEESFEWENCVIACGGGTPCFFSNMDSIKKKGVSIWLDTSLDVIVRRIKEFEGQRPLFFGIAEDSVKEKAATHLASRRPFYALADIRWNGDYLDDMKQIDKNISDFVKIYPEI